MKRAMNVILPLMVLAAGVAGAAIMMATAPQIEEQPAEAVAPLVAVESVEPQTLQLSVRTQGTVSARTEADLIPQVSGVVAEISAKLISGGFFDAGDVLLRIEPDDYEVAVERARAGLARAQSDFSRAQKELARLMRLSKRGVASESQLDDARLAERVSAAATREAEAVLRQADRDLGRTRVSAPFTGRVRRESVDVGQFVNRGAPIARLYATDVAEVRLPLADEELAFVELPFWRRDAANPTAGPEVVLRADFAGGRHEWRGRVVRTEGEIDARSRMVNVVARVEDPYADRGDGRPPLAVGLFVEAEILGRTVRDVVVAPRGTMRDRDHILVVDAESRLRLRWADVVRRQHDEVIVAASTFREGDRLVLSGMETAVDGMRVRPIERGADAFGDIREILSEPRG